MIGATPSDFVLAKPRVFLICTPLKGDDAPGCSEWEEKAANLPKAAIKRRGNIDAQVVQKLAAVGVWENERNLRNELWGGKFTAAFLLQCLGALGTDSLRLV